NVAGQYVKDWLSGGEVSSADEVPPGEGAVVRRGLSKVAIYRDERGETHECSAVCTHLGCIVHWNGAEKTWDCPCHGSHFSPARQAVGLPLPRLALRAARRGHQRPRQQAVDAGPAGAAGRGRQVTVLNRPL